MAPKKNVRPKLSLSQVKALLPIDRSPESKAKRMQLFRAFDPNDNGFLSLAECDRGMRDVLRLDEIFNVKPVIIRAFNAAKSIAQTMQARNGAPPAPAVANNNRATPSKGAAKKSVPLDGGDYVERSEFRIFLEYLGRYFELWELFAAIDDDNDRRIDLEEFIKATPLINEWGGNIVDPEKTFKEIDTNGGGILLFDEFAHWALMKRLDEIHPDD